MNEGGSRDQQSGGHASHVKFCGSRTDCDPKNWVQLELQTDVPFSKSEIRITYLLWYILGTLNTK